MGNLRGRGMVLCVEVIDVGYVVLDDLVDDEVELVFDLVIAWMVAIGLAGFKFVICGVLLTMVNGCGRSSMVCNSVSEGSWGRTTRDKASAT